MWVRTQFPGISMRHTKACGGHNAGRCRGCAATYRVRYQDRAGKWQYSKTFKSLTEAREWQLKPTDAPVISTVDLNALADEWFNLAEKGAITKGGGKRYGAETLVTYRRMYNGHVRPEIGTRPVAALTSRDWQRWIESLVLAGLKRNSISVTLNAVRSVYSWACSPVHRDEPLPINATIGVRLPAHDETPRNRIASPDEAAKLLAALDMSNRSTTFLLEPCDKVSYAISLYAGLRNVERLHVEWSDIDADFTTLHVRVSKGEAKPRTLPIVGPLRLILKQEWMRQGKPDTGLVCVGPYGGAPKLDSVRDRAVKMWEAAGLTPIGFHECRHTFITTMIASGLNAKAVSILAGHSSIAITYDRYGHLFDGHEAEAGRMLDAFYGQPVVNQDAQPAAVSQIR